MLFVFVFFAAGCPRLGASVSLKMLCCQKDVFFFQQRSKDNDPFSFMVSLTVRQLIKQLYINRRKNYHKQASEKKKN
jgi:hypothetical protein